jgi:tetratricopeptide (TPR) repeat protein
MSPLRTAPPSSLLKAALLVLVGAWIYWPAIHGGWIWDDSAEIARNPIMSDPAGLAKIWVSPVTPDFFPLKTTLQWFLWRLWGGNPTPYHLLTLGLHLLSALLFWRVLQKLGLRLAWLGGLLLVVHPLVVESVAWVAELKNTLSLALLLVAMIAYLDYDDRLGATNPELPARPAYLWSLGFFLLAALSKSSVVMFPFVILLYVWWRRGRIRRKDWIDSLPFFAVSLILGLITISFQQHRALASWSIPLGGLDSRVACAGVGLAFYFWKSVLPLHLLLMYPQWSVNPPSLWQFLPWPVVILFFGYFWINRTTWGRAVLFGVGFFILNLLPILGFVSMAYMHIAWVADHFAYLPLLGLVGLAVAGAGSLANRMAASPSGLRLAAISALGLVLAALAWESRAQAALFGDQEALWSATLRENPGAWMAQINLGQYLGESGRGQEALGHYTDALRIRSDLPEAYYNRGSTLEQLGRHAEAIEDLEHALQLEPANPDAQVNLGNALLRSGRLPDAITHYQEALRLQPGAADARNYLAGAHLQLGNTLVQEHRYADALAEYQQSLQFGPDNADAHKRLGYLFLGFHRPSEAVLQYQEALRLRPDDPEARQGLALARRFQQGSP